MTTLGLDTKEIFDLLDRGAWLAAAALLIGLLARAAKDPRFFGGPLARIPRERRVYVVLGLGVVSGVLEALVRGTSWPAAVVKGVLSAGLSVLAHNLAGGLSPVAPAAPEAKGDLPVAPGPVVDTTLTDVPSGPPAGIAAPPGVEPPFAWGPRPSEETS